MTERTSARLPHCGWVHGKGQPPQPFLITATNADGSAVGYRAGNNQTIPAGEWFGCCQPAMKTKFSGLNCWVTKPHLPVRLAHLHQRAKQL